MEKQLNGAQRGHQKDMKRIEKKGARQICLSKRCNGLFKKASELSTLCGAEVAIIVYSPAGKPYTFGCPAVDPIINKFLSDNSDQPDHFSSANNSQNLHQGAIISHLNQQYADTLSRLDTETLQQLMMLQGLKQAAKESPKVYLG
ncbi:hypothetical protein LUZ62_039293 [Rhynchospora pubera]|uniref:MADS-box domain-containing protein n=1 Tax=Rhynchospora pubera TaxID=906938 RepID=A0AAV8ES25_9POAL|nr:hypothetical protein LUZ62_065370 [Rhynchospora pubera]KAJ4788047.1 hypothetical protein LUZ62_039293 [Rhynchospora pubera]